MCFTQAFKQTFVPEIIIAKEAVILSSFNGDINGSRSSHRMQEIADADGFVVV